VSYEFCMLYKYRSLQLADLSSRGALPCVYGSLSMIKGKNNPLYLKLIGIRGQNEPKQMKEKHFCRILQHT
jgi:hypothetical protein